MQQICDLFIIGGGVNGAGIARDAAGRGLRVVLAEQGDLAQGTSSASTKLIHGGLRYLEHYAFGLVRESLREREILLTRAPHIVRPMRFVLPHAPGMRPAWMLRAGLWLYDGLAGRSALPPSRRLDLSHDPAGQALQADFSRGFEYSDCWVEDARLVVLNAMDAAHYGADIRVRTRVTRAQRCDGLWHIAMTGPDGAVQEIAAHALVNATGPWLALAGACISQSQPPPRVRLVQGSHIVTRRLFAGDRAFLFQNFDRRVVFAIPYENDFTLIGTTDRDFSGDPADAAASEDERAYLITAANRFLRTQISDADILQTFAGVRALADADAGAAQSASREYRLHLDAPAGEAPLLQIAGGKLTTYRSLADKALAALQPFFAQMTRPAWTHQAFLPGGDMQRGDMPGGMAPHLQHLVDTRSWLPRDLAQRLIRTYGSLAADLMGDASSLADMGRDFGHGLTLREVDYLRQQEFARTAEDILTRRTRLGLRFDAGLTRALREHMGG